MNERERAICARVRMCREGIKWSQSAFAQELGISRDKLASIEYGRTPLRYPDAFTICEVFDINQEWLATGKGNQHGYRLVLWSAEDRSKAVTLEALFTEVYDYAPEAFEPEHYGRRKKFEMRGTPGLVPQSYLIQRLLWFFDRTKFKTPEDAETCAFEIAAFAEKTFQKYRRKGNATRIRSAMRRIDKKQ